MAKFYNPGFSWNERKIVDNPFGDVREGNLISHYVIEAPERGFFEVLDVFPISLPSGETVDLPLRIKDLVRVEYAERGVVLIAPGRVCSETENIAPTKEEAKAKGDAMWKIFTLKKCNEWFGIVEEVRAAGRLPRPAEDLFKRCLKERGIADPADVATGLSAAKEGQQENKELQAQIAALTATVNQLIGAKNAQGK